MRKAIYPTQEEWKNKRPYQIGASEVATIVGVSRYGSIVDLYERKRNKVTETEENKAMLWGHAFEDGVARLFEKETGLKVRDDTRGDWQFVNEEQPWMSCSPDRLYWLDGEGDPTDYTSQGLLECKTTVVDPEEERNKWMLQSWYCQVQWQLMVAEMDDAHLCCAVFGYDRKTITRHWRADPAFQGKLKEIVSRFWFDNVQKGVPPLPRKREDVDSLFPVEVKGKTVTADDGILSTYNDLKAVRDNLRMLTERETELRDRLILSMKDAEAIVDSEGSAICTYKASRVSRRFDTDAFKVANPELYEKYCKEVEGSRRFLLK